MSAISQKLNNILKDLEKNSEVIGSAIVNKRGQMMASALHRDIDEKAVAAMTAALSAVSSRVASTLEIGGINSIIINGDEKLLFLQQLPKATLVAIAPADAKIGLIDYEVEKCVKQIKSILDI